MAGAPRAAPDRGTHHGGALLVPQLAHELPGVALGQLNLLAVCCIAGRELLDAQDLREVRRRRLHPAGRLHLRACDQGADQARGSKLVAAAGNPNRHPRRAGAESRPGRRSGPCARPVRRPWDAGPGSSTARRPGWSREWPVGASRSGPPGRRGATDRLLRAPGQLVTPPRSAGRAHAARATLLTGRHDSSARGAARPRRAGSRRGRDESSTTARGPAARPQRGVSHLRAVENYQLGSQRLACGGRLWRDGVENGGRVIAAAIRGAARVAAREGGAMALTGPGGSVGGGGVGGVYYEIGSTSGWPPLVYHRESFRELRRQQLECDSAAALTRRRCGTLLPSLLCNRGTSANPAAHRCSPSTQWRRRPGWWCCTASPPPMSWGS
jgi:hypothetical protein